MSYNLLWIFLLILRSFTASFPVPNQYDLGVIGIDQEPLKNSPTISRYEDLPDSSDEKVISVRITSSVAVGRGKGKPTYRYAGDMLDHDLQNTPAKVSPSDAQPPTITSKLQEMVVTGATDVPSNLIGANIEYIKQLNAKKESRDNSADPVHHFELIVKGQNGNIEEPSPRMDEYEEDSDDIPLARKVPSTADANRFQDQKTMYRFQSPDTSPSTEAHVQNQHINMTSVSLFVPDIKLGFKTINNNDSKNVKSVIPLPKVDQNTDEKGTGNIDRLIRIDTFTSNSKNYQSDDSVAEPSIKTVEFTKYNERIENIPPTATSATLPPVRSPNKGLDLTNRPQNEGRNNPRLTTVSFNIVHDTPRITNDNDPSTSYISSSQIVPNQKQLNYDPPKVYSEPAKIYSEPAKFYSEPAKIYSEPAKIYSEPAKVYSEPAKIYSEPSKFYSEPASLHLDQNVPSSIPPSYSPWRPQRPIGSTTVNTTPLSTVTNVFQQDTTVEHQPEKNYEVDEKISVLTDGRSHGVQQDTTTDKCKQDNCKVGYVLEGRQFKKYRVEERTPDGFIVGEYGVVRNEDGALRGVRYTADSDASPRLIHDALMKFLQLT